MARPETHYKPRFTVAKYGGGDSYSYAVLDQQNGGKPVVTGCTQAEARYHQQQIRERERQS